MSSYENFMGGKLKLKRNGLQDVGVKKRKKKHHRKNKSIAADIDAALASDAAAKAAVNGAGAGNNDNNGNSSSTVESAGAVSRDHAADVAREAETSFLTPAQQRYEVIRRQREEAVLKQEASESFRDRMVKLNKKLEELPEHHDIPKVGPG